MDMTYLVVILLYCC